MACQGTVKSFHHDKGFGFIDYQGTDVFFHVKDCQGNPPKQGDVLTFDTSPSDKDPSKLKASNVTGGTGQPQQLQQAGGPPVKGTGAYHGMCKSFNGGKAWGFIEFQGQDIFVHKKNCLGNPPKAGDTLQFDMEENPVKAGTMHAINCTGGTGVDESFKGKGKGKDDWGMGGWGGGMGAKGGYGPAMAMGGGWGGAGDGWGMGGGGGWGMGGGPYGGKGGKGDYGGKGGFGAWGGW